MKHLYFNITTFTNSQQIKCKPEARHLFKVHTNGTLRCNKVVLLSSWIVDIMGTVCTLTSRVSLYAVAEFEEKFAVKCWKVGQLRALCWIAEGEITGQNMASHLAAARRHVREGKVVYQNTGFCSTVMYGPHQMRRSSVLTEAPWYCQTCKTGY